MTQIRELNRSHVGSRFDFYTVQLVNREIFNTCVNHTFMNDEAKPGARNTVTKFFTYV